MGVLDQSTLKSGEDKEIPPYPQAQGFAGGGSATVTACVWRLGGTCTVGAPCALGPFTCLRGRASFLHFLGGVGSCWRLGLRRLLLCSLLLVGLLGDPVGCPKPAGLTQHAVWVTAGQGTKEYSDPKKKINSQARSTSQSEGKKKERGGGVLKARGLAQSLSLL